MIAQAPAIDTAWTSPAWFRPGRQLPSPDARGQRLAASPQTGLPACRPSARSASMAVTEGHLGPRCRRRRFYGLELAQAHRRVARTRHEAFLGGGYSA